MNKYYQSPQIELVLFDDVVTASGGNSWNSGSGGDTPNIEGLM